MAGWLTGWLAGWLGGWQAGWLSDNYTTTWPILQAKASQIFSKAGSSRWSECDKNHSKYSSTSTPLGPTFFPNILGL